MSTPTIQPLRLLTKLINELASLTPPSPIPPNHNALSALPSQDAKKARSLLTTLHCIFPNEVLLAVDLLDRRLLTRLVIADDNGTDQTNDGYGEVYHVQSASASQSATSTSRYARRPPSNTSTTYEVRLNSWNCSCPAFAFSAFGRGLDLNSDSEDDEGERGIVLGEQDDEQKHWRFGGELTRGASKETPVCKHLLACVLGSRVKGLFGDGVEQRIVSREEMAGWAAGWGE